LSGQSGGRHRIYPKQGEPGRRRRELLRPTWGIDQSKPDKELNAAPHPSRKLGHERRALGRSDFHERDVGPRSAAAEHAASCRASVANPFQLTKRQDVAPAFDLEG